MDIFETLCRLSEKDGVSGSNDDFCCYAENILKEYCKTTSIDKCGNVIGFIPSDKKDAKTLMIEAHLDRIGLMVKAVDENGFIEFEPVGGVDKRILPSAVVTVCGREKIFGVIGAKPPHLRTSDDSDSSPDFKDMLIDVGLSAESLRKIVRTGDFIVLHSKPERMLNNRVSGAALDNRAGMTAVIDFLEKAKGKKLPYNIYAVFTSGEECGLVGAGVAAHNINPDISVSIDVTFGAESEADYIPGTFPLGCGAVIFRGPDTCYEGSLKLIEIAKQKNIPYEIEASSSSGTNASVIQNARGAKETYLISIPLKYMHQTVEMLSLDDISAVGDLILEVASGGVCND